jgi:dihydrofolate synthase/folylpolyglutamate synthase
VAHNPAGIGEVMQQWKQVAATTKHIVLGFVKDKDINEALALFPKDAVYHFCNADTPRALPAGELQAAAAQQGLKGEAYETVAKAVRGAQAQMQDTDALLITGSFFIVGEALSICKFENVQN